MRDLGYRHTDGTLSTRHGQVLRGAVEDCEAFLRHEHAALTHAAFLLSGDENTARVLAQEVALRVLAAWPKVASEPDAETKCSADGEPLSVDLDSDERRDVRLLRSTPGTASALAGSSPTGPAFHVLQPGCVPIPSHHERRVVARRRRARAPGRPA